MSVNDITGDPIRTDVPSEKFKSGWEAIWGGKEKNSFHVAFDHTKECSPYLTQCPRCNNPSNACDKTISQP